MRSRFPDSAMTYEQYEAEYLRNLTSDTEEIRNIREVLNSLPLPEKRIFVLYTEIGTYSGVAKVLKCSVPTVSKRVRAIREKIIKKLNGTDRN